MGAVKRRAKTLVEVFGGGEVQEPWALFLDDERDPVDGGEWVVCRSTDEAVTETRVRGCPPSVMSLDHDLGDDDTAMLYLRWVTVTYDNWDFTYRVHSQNPVGRDNIVSLLECYRRAYGGGGGE